MKRPLSNRVMRLQIHQTMVGRWFYFGFHLFFSAAPALVYFVGGWQAISGSLTIGNLVAFIALQTRLFTPFKDLLDAYGEVQAALAVFERLYSYAELPVDVQERSDAIMLQKCTGLVSFNDVHFSYTQHGQTLTGITFSAKPGQLVALVGPSGAGKTTITHLLARFYDVDRGTICIDAHDVRTLRLDSIAKYVGIVTQDIYLWHDTISNNIRYGNPDADDSNVVIAAKAAHVADRRYDTGVGQG